MSADEGGFSPVTGKFSTLPRSTKLWDAADASSNDIYANSKKNHQHNNSHNFVNNNVHSEKSTDPSKSQSNEMRIIPIEVEKPHTSTVSFAPSASAPSSPFINIRRKFFANFENKSTENLNSNGVDANGKKDQPLMGSAIRKIKLDKSRLSMIKEDTDQEKVESLTNKQRLGNGSFLKLSRLSFRKERPDNRMNELGSQNLPPMNSPITRGVDFKSVSTPKLVEHDSDEDEGIYDAVEFRRDLELRRSLDWKPSFNYHREPLSNLKRPESLSSLNRVPIRPFERRSNICREWRDLKALENYRNAKLSTAV